MSYNKIKCKQNGVSKLQSVENELFRLQDKGYKQFHAKLIPSVSSDTVIGVRTPDLKKLAKILPLNIKENFIKQLPHKYYEENNLHAFVICNISDFESCIIEIERFLPYIDNWATCDGLRPKCFIKNRALLMEYIDKWMKSSHTYTIRFGIEMLMTHFLDEYFEVKHLKKVANIKSDEYYVNMMCAWYFATALAKQYDSTLPVLENNILPVWVHNKSIQKAVESFRITNEQKSYLKTLKRKI